MSALRRLSYDQPADVGGGGMNEVIIARPLPWDEYAAGMFRLPGFGGAAVFLRAAVVPTGGGLVDDEAGAWLSLDVGLLSPQSFTRYLARAATAGLADRLSALFLSAAADEAPESTVAPLVDEVLGLRVEVISSDEARVGLLVSLVKDLEEPEAEPDGLDFETSRAALAQAAREVRFLDHVDDDPGGVSEPPVDWSSL